MVLGGIWDGECFVIVLHNRLGFNCGRLDMEMDYVWVYYAALQGVSGNVYLVTWKLCRVLSE